MLFACSKETIKITDCGGSYLLSFRPGAQYLMLPVEDKAPEVTMELYEEDSLCSTMTVRLADDTLDYFVPVDLSPYSRELQIRIGHDLSALCLNGFRLADRYDVEKDETFRSRFHHTPEYGWMNDPNGLIFFDGEYHLFYQHNPYGAQWGNMTWGHSVSRDMIHWESVGNAISPDSLGTIFSGCCIIDRHNSAGFGENTMVAIYTANAPHRQTQCLAYSLDRGRTFQKYEGNPVLISTGERDFRDPKVFWHEPSERWIMVLAAGQKINFYSSKDLKSWDMESSFRGNGGPTDGLWECPDLFEIAVEGEPAGNSKWVLLCSTFPNRPVGSAVQYFVGEFDGHHFICDETPLKTMWLDHGKDVYAVNTWTDEPQGRRVAIGWMSNVAYAGDIPTRYFRGTNTLPRELTLHRSGDGWQLQSRPCIEFNKLLGSCRSFETTDVGSNYNLDTILPENDGTYELCVTIENDGADYFGLKLFNNAGEYVDFNADAINQLFTVDRSKSGQIGFSQQFTPSWEFPLHQTRICSLRMIIDRSSIECFLNHGEETVTFLIFPSEPYNRLNIYSHGGILHIKKLEVYRINSAKEK